MPVFGDLAGTAAAEKGRGEKDEGQSFYRHKHRVPGEAGGYL
jgi:hypothetical protein